MIKKRLFSAMLSILAITCPVSDFNIFETTESVAMEAEDISVNTGTCGDHVTYSIDDTGNLTISGNGAIYDYADGENPFSDNEQIKQAAIEEGITHIGEYVFANCTSLTSVIIPDSVTSIGQYAFSGSAVKSIVIPESVITLDTNSMFMDCKELESVVLPQSVTVLYTNAFKNCVKLKEVDIPDSVTAIQNDVFSGTTFTSLFIPSEVAMINGNALRGSKIDTIYGFKDSTAETFAKKNGLNFIEREERVWKRTDSLPIAGVYKLECDVDVKNYITISEMLDLDLNGHTVNIPEIICSSTSNVIIRDSDPQKKGSMICTEDRNLITSYHKLTIYGGNFYGYDKKTVCATVRINDGNFDFYGGEITGYYSHALSVRTKDGIINIMGGKMEASSAENGKTNVYSVWLADTFAGTLNITGGDLHADLGAAVRGSPSDCIVNISGGKLLSDCDYGFKCMKKGTVNLSGNICMKGEKGGIYVPDGRTVNITGAITGADVSVYAEASGLLTNGLGKYISASTLNRYLPDIKANGTISVNNDGELIIDVPVVSSTTAVSGSVTSTTSTTSTTSKPVATTATTMPVSTNTPVTTSVSYPSAQIYARIVRANPGETVRIPVFLQNNPGITSLSLNFSYDSTKLELLGVENGHVFASADFTPGGDLHAVPYTVKWESASQNNLNGDGIVAFLQVHVPEDAEGNIPIDLTLNQKETFNADLEEVEFDTLYGMVMVPPAATTAKPVTTTAKATTTTAKATTTTAKATTTTAKATTTTAKATTTTAEATTTTAEATTTTAKATTTTFKATTTTEKSTTTTAMVTTTTAIATTTATPVTTTTPTETAPVVTTFVEPAPLRGDVDGDGAVSIEDVQIALQAYTKRVSGKDMGLTDRQIKAADVNADGELSVDDVQNILIYYVNNTVAQKVLTWDDILGEKTDITETQPASKEYGTLMQDYYTALMNTWNYGGESAASCDFDFTGLGKDIDLTFEWEDYKLTYRAIVGCDWIVYYFFDAEPKQGQDYAQFENDDPDSARVNKLFIKESKDNFSFVQIIPRLVKPEDTSLENGVWHCVGMLINTSDDPGFHGKNAGMQIWFTENPSGDKSDEELISYDPIEFAPREFPLYPCAEVEFEPGFAENDGALEVYAEQEALNEKHPLTRCANTPFGNFYFSEGEPEPDGLWYSSRMRGGVLTVCGVEPTLQYTSYYGDSGHDGQYNAFLFVLFEKPVNVPEALSE